MKLNDNTITSAVSRAMRELSDESGYADRISELDFATIRDIAEMHALERTQYGEHFRVLKMELTRRKELLDAFAFQKTDSKSKI